MSPMVGVLSFVIGLEYGETVLIDDKNRRNAAYGYVKTTFLRPYIRTVSGWVGGPI